MYIFTKDELLGLSADELRLLEESSRSGDSVAQWKMAMSILYGQAEGYTTGDVVKYLKPLVDQKNKNALLLMGYIYEHSIGVKKSYTKALEYYAQAYDIIHDIKPLSSKADLDAAESLKEMEASYVKLTKEIAKVVVTKNLCRFKNKSFVFEWNDDTRSSLNKLLPKLSDKIAQFGSLHNVAISNLKEESQGLWEFRYQNTLLMPLEILKALVARDLFENHLNSCDLNTFDADKYFNNALGRCLIDDDDASDNDYIISGLLNMAGHDECALWQYRVGLWYEYNDNNLEPKSAAYWYGLAQKENQAAKIALERLKGQAHYRIVESREEGTIEECQTLLTRSANNPQNSIGWLIEGALRGDHSALNRIEKNQLAPQNGKSVLNEDNISDSPKSFSAKSEEESAYDKENHKAWVAAVKKERTLYRKRLEDEARKKADEERKAEEAKRRKAEEEERKRLEEERKAEEEERKAEEAKRRKAEEKERQAEEERKKALEAEKAHQKLINEVVSLKEEVEEAISEMRSNCEEKFDDLKSNLNAAKSSLKTKLNVAKPKLHHYLFCSAPYKSADDFVSSEEATCATLLRELEASIDKANKAYSKFESSITSDYSDKSSTALKTFVTKLKKLAGELIDAKNSGKKQVAEIKKHIKYLNNDISASDFEYEFNGYKTIFVLSLLWAIVSLIISLITNNFKWWCSWTISCGVIGCSLYAAQNLSFGTIFKGFAMGSGVAITAAVIWVFVKPDNTDSSSYANEAHREVVEVTKSGTMEEEMAAAQQAAHDAVDKVTKDVEAAQQAARDAVNKATKEVEAAQTETVSLDYEYIYSAESNGWRKVKNDDKYGFINKSGKLVVPVKYDYIYSAEGNGWRKVQVGDKYGFIDGDGKEIIKAKYDYIYSPEENGWRKVELNSKYGFVNSSGTEIVTPKYSYIYNKDEKGWRKVEIKSKYGFINDSGVEIVAPVYDYIYDWSGGLARVEKGNKTGYINRSGKLVQPLE
ncbi:MAG: WG repeat-containing protein [Alistipes sp.]|nr:WG repeat-containing protein [Alistipes sp.]